MKFIKIKLSFITTPSKATIPMTPVMEIGSPLKSTPTVIPTIVKGRIDIIKRGWKYDLKIVANIR